ncbi:MAG: putative HNHc nuclease [Enterococcus casseliflavus]
MKEINPEFLKLLARDKENLTDVKLIDNEPKSAKQNALAHALIKDIAKHQELPLHKAKQMMKDLYKEGHGIEFSHAEASMTEMNTWVEFLIEHVLIEGISLPKRYSYLLELREILLLLLQVP